jgi:hypothetical protein
MARTRFKVGPEIQVEGSGVKIDFKLLSGRDKAGICLRFPLYSPTGNCERLLVKFTRQAVMQPALYIEQLRRVWLTR